MITDIIIQGIEALADRYPHRESALIPALDLVQRANGNHLALEDVRVVARLFGISFSRAWGVATYYTLLNKAPVGQYHLQVDLNVPGMLMGADGILDHLEDRLGIKAGETTTDGLFTLSRVEDLGFGGTCPVVQVNDVIYESMTVPRVETLLASLRAGVMPAHETVCHTGGECGILLRNRLTPGAGSLQIALEGGAYRALKKARTMTPGAVIEEVKASGLQGRGGAGFATGLKFGFLPREDALPVYLICNADEGEPGTFKDRQIMEFDPHLLLEGMAIAAYAIGCTKAFLYIRGEFRWISEILETAVEEAAQAGLLGSLAIVVHRGAGSYVCGEETALLESLEGKRGQPRPKPPFPAQRGLYGCPTIVNNVETLACLPFIIDRGARAFRSIGHTGGFGPKLFSVSGHVHRPGVYEFPLGTPLTTILEAAGGVQGALKGVIVGGLSAPILRPEEIPGLHMDYEACAKAGTMLGSGGIMVINDTVTMPALAARTIRFYAHESCGQCTPCREGAAFVKDRIQALLDGNGVSSDLDRVLAICRIIPGTTLCPMGTAFAAPIRAMIEKYRPEFDALVPSKRRKESAS